MGHFVSHIIQVLKAYTAYTSFIILHFTSLPFDRPNRPFAWLGLNFGYLRMPGEDATWSDRGPCECSSKFRGKMDKWRCSHNVSHWSGKWNKEHSESSYQGFMAGMLSTGWAMRQDETFFLCLGQNSVVWQEFRTWMYFGGIKNRVEIEREIEEICLAFRSWTVSLRDRSIRAMHSAIWPSR